MLIERGNIRTWLYTSQLKIPLNESQVEDLVDGFKEKNARLDLTGFLLTNGLAVMQLLEGPPEPMITMRDVISADDRHEDVVSEVWELESGRAYPKWKMRSVPPCSYEKMFKEIECSKMETIATNIARMLFDTTFEC